MEIESLAGELSMMHRPSPGLQVDNSCLAQTCSGWKSQELREGREIMNQITWSFPTAQFGLHMERGPDCYIQSIESLKWWDFHSFS